MQKLEITGGRKISGTIAISGSKNAALSIIAASIMTEERIVLENIPHLEDITTMIRLIAGMGVSITLVDENKLILDSSKIKNFIAPYDLVKTMRASILVLGPLIARFGEASVSLPGGCAIGARPVNLHLDGLKAMGADIQINEGYICAKSKKLKGTINISGSKNATLPILAASILSKKKIIIQNIPLVKDVETMIDLLSLLGSKVKLTKKKKKIEILNNNKLSTFVPYKLVKTMRAGVLVLGPLLARYNKAKVSLPGGCAIGSRPVDLHLEALKKMGVSFKIRDGYINAIAKNGLIGNKITFPKISVGATENTMIAACLAKGCLLYTSDAADE